MKIPLLLSFVVTLAQMSHADAVEIYTYDVQLNETVALQNLGTQGIALIPLNQQRISKAYSCEIEVVVAPSDEKFSGSFDGWPKRKWNFQATSKISASARCPGANGARILECFMFPKYYRGTWTERDYINGRPSGSPRTQAKECLSRRASASVSEFPQSLDYTSHSPCEDFNPLVPQRFEGWTTANFVRPTLDSGLGLTPSLLSFENGKISGYSDEILFSGNYKLKSN